MGIHRLNFIFSCSIFGHRERKGIQAEEEEEEGKEEGRRERWMRHSVVRNSEEISLLCSVGNDDRRDREIGGKGQAGANKQLGEPQ